MKSKPFNINNASYRSKMLAIDFDHTIVTPQNCRKFPKDKDDWEWFDESVPDKIKQYYDNEYMIVIFTNQSKQWKCEQIKIVTEILELPMFVVIATEKSEYKPNKQLFETFIGENTIDLENSLFIGDALGRKTDFSDSDKMFAENIGIKCVPPESIFTTPIEQFEIPLSTQQEIIIMVGYPGSGKTTIAKNICERNENYIHILGDVCKTIPKIKKAIKDGIKQGKSIIIDATNNSIKKRKEYINIAQENEYNITCIHMTTSMTHSYKGNLKRSEDKRVPLVAYHVYNKYFDPPTEEEGFMLVKV